MSEIVSTKNAPSAIGPYSQAIIANGFMFSSGQIPLSPETGDVVCNDISGQTVQVCENIRAILEEKGLSFTDVVKTACYIADMNDFSAFNGVYERYFIGKPARSCVAVKALPKNVLCEIEIIAALNT